MTDFCVLLFAEFFFDVISLMIHLMCAPLRNICRRYDVLRCCVVYKYEKKMFNKSEILQMGVGELKTAQISRK